MSHFCGLVIMTPEYAESSNLDCSLDRFYEGNDVDEYSCGEVSDYDKISFLSYYNKDKVDLNNVHHLFAVKNEGADGYMTFAEFQQEYNSIERNRYESILTYDHKEDYTKFWIETYPEIFKTFEECYKKHGNDWNGNNWRKNPDDGIWYAYSTYNPDSKWDWYEVGGRWAKSIKTKSRKYVDQCTLGEIDLTPFKESDYCKRTEKDWRGNTYHPLKKNVQWHYTEKDSPYCIIIDGEWYEKGEMGWWGMSSNEKDTDVWDAEFVKLIKELPADSYVYNVDFHI